MFGYALDGKASMAVELIVAPYRAGEDAIALVQYTRQAAIQFDGGSQPALIVVLEIAGAGMSHMTMHALGEATFKHPEPPLVALVTENETAHRLIRALPWFGVTNVTAVGTFEEAVRWVERARGENLLPHFSELLEEARRMAEEAPSTPADDPSRGVPPRGPHP